MCSYDCCVENAIHPPFHQQDLIDKLVDEEKERNHLTDSSKSIPYISVAARVVQVGSSSNEQGQCEEQHTSSIPLEGMAKRERTRTISKH